MFLDQSATRFHALDVDRVREAVMKAERRQVCTAATVQRWCNHASVQEFDSRHRHWPPGRPSAPVSVLTATKASTPAAPTGTGSERPEYYCDLSGSAAAVHTLIVMPVSIL